MNDGKVAKVTKCKETRGKTQIKIEIDLAPSAKSTNKLTITETEKNKITWENPEKEKPWIFV